MPATRQAAALERHLERHPDDQRARYYLGLLLSSEGQDPEAGQRHLLRWLLDILDEGDASEAEARLRASIEAKQDNRSRLLLGHLLGYLGRSDEAECLLRTATRWSTVRTTHFELSTVEGSTAAAEIESIAARREQGLDTIEALFGCRPEPGSPIRYFFYETELHKGVVTDDPMPAHAFSDQAEVHVTYGLGSRVEGIHEDVHVLLRGLGRPCRFLEEGAAIYAERPEEAHSWLAAAIGDRQPPPLARLLDDTAFDTSDLFITYPMAGSFAAFLIASHGRDSFLELYPTPEDQIATRLEGLTGLSLPDLEAVWLRTARADAQMREGACSS